MQRTQSYFLFNKLFYCKFLDFSIAIMKIALVFITLKPKSKGNPSSNYKVNDT